MASCCARCRRYHAYGHRDPDNHHWYCEDCWQGFCGPRRVCQRCRRPGERGVVNVADQYWYCSGCFERLQASPLPTPREPAMWPACHPSGGREGCAPPPPPGVRAPPMMMPGPPPPPGPRYPLEQRPALAPGMGWVCAGPPPPLMLPSLGYSADPWRPFSRSRSPPSSARARQTGGGGGGGGGGRRQRRPTAGGGRSPSRGSGKGTKRRFKPYHATVVPKELDLEEQYLSGDVPDRETTAMLRNIPNKYMQSTLLEEIDSQGFANKYDFFYLPMDVRNKTNVGYAFINFRAPEDLKGFCERFAGRQFEAHPSQKIATVSPAHVQGLERNVRNLSQKAVAQFRDSQYQPIVFRGDGARIGFHEAVRELALGGRLLSRPPDAGVAGRKDHA